MALKLVTVVGARPQFIKAAALSRVWRADYSERVREVMVHTGQHYDPDLSEVFFTELNIPREDYNLAIGSGSHAQQTGKMLMEMERILLAEKPDALLLYGDTNSTLAGCLAAIKLGIPIIHVEAGVRAYLKEMPEEVNRIICDHMATLLFVPSDAGMESLAKEGFAADPHSGKATADKPKVFRCGDIMYDNTLFYRQHVSKMGNAVHEKFGIPSNNYILATMHRPHNVDDPKVLEAVMEGLIGIGMQHAMPIVLPLHPRTLSRLDALPETIRQRFNEVVKVLPPVSFLDMVALEEGATLVITDSGGVQKEAYFMEKPCLILMHETPWPELVKSGNAMLCGSDPHRMMKAADHFLKLDTELQFKPLYGDGKASEFICKTIFEELSPSMP